MNNEQTQVEDFAEFGVDYNFERPEVDRIFEELLKCDGIPLHLKKTLYFLQADQ